MRRWAMLRKNHDKNEDSGPHRLEDYISVAFLAILVIVVSLQVVSRYLFKSPLLWTEETARYLLLVLTFVGSSIAVRRGSNVSLDFILGKLPKKARSGLSVVSLSLELCFYAACAYLSVNMLIFSKGRYLVSVRISRSLIYGLVAFGFALMTLRCLVRLIDQLKTMTKKTESEAR